MCQSALSQIEIIDVVSFFSVVPATALGIHGLKSLQNSIPQALSPLESIVWAPKKQAIEQRHSQKKEIVLLSFADAYKWPLLLAFGAIPCSKIKASDIATYHFLANLSADHWDWLPYWATVGATTEDYDRWK